jgi:hypothetical protein
MSNAALVAILLVFFALAIGLVRLLGAMIERGGDPEEHVEEPLDGAPRPVGYPWPR